MYCPHCGTQQASNEIRFCSRCGFPMHIVAELLAGGGNLPALASNVQGQQLTPRQKGIRQGAMLMLSTLLVVPLMAIISVFIFHKPQLFVPIAAIGCFVGGFLRIMYALLIEDNMPVINQLAGVRQSSSLPNATPPAYLNAPRQSFLQPQPQNFSAPVYQPPRHNTGEIVSPPPSITEHTTRLLETPVVAKSDDELSES